MLTAQYIEGLYLNAEPRIELGAVLQQRIAHYHWYIFMYYYITSRISIIIIYEAFLGSNWHTHL